MWVMELNLYDIIPENLFSILVSKNKTLYTKSLFTLLLIFKRHLKISKNELVSTISETLEDEIRTADFTDEVLLENEVSYSGKAHFLVRKLRDTGWIMIETELDFQEYITLPLYTIKIVTLLNELTNTAPKENFAYVYSTYSSLKNADSTRDLHEMITALYDGVQRTEQLVESLKSVYHGITYYYQQQIDMVSVNKVLDLHFTMYREEIVDKILRPLKIKDSVPKYKMPITLILKKWVVENDTIENMANYLLTSNKFAVIEECRNDIRSCIFNIIDTYEGLEKDYIKVIDDKNRQYTRATTQKIDYLLNSDQNVRGNLITLLKEISFDDTYIDEISSSFEIYSQNYICEESLYERKNSIKRTSEEPLEIEPDDNDFENKAKAAAMLILKNKYSKQKINLFVLEILGDKDTVSTEDFEVLDDETYIMTLLSVVYSSDHDSFYKIEFLQKNIKKGIYDLPLMIYKRK